MNNTKTNKKAQGKTTNVIEINQIIRKCNQTMSEMKALTWKEAEVGITFDQNAKISLIDDQTLIVGGDIGSAKHDFRAFDWRGREFSQKALEISNDEKGFEMVKSWILFHKEKQGLQKVIIGMEPTGHYWFNIAGWLMEQGFTVVLVNPHHVKKSKELDDNLNRKTDRKDPKVIAGLVRDGRYGLPYIPTGVYAELRSMTRIRLTNTEEKTRTMNRIKRWFSMHFPEYPIIYQKLDAVGSLLLLEQVALPEDIISLGALKINEIWRKVKLRAVGINKANAIVSAARRTIGRTEDPEAARYEIKWLLMQLNLYLDEENKIEAKLEELSKQISNIDKVLEIKGPGLKTVATIVAEIGELDRFNDVKQIQKLAGLALVEDSSGKHEGQTKISKRGRKRLRYQLYQAGLLLVGHNKEFKELHAYYTTREENPLKKMQSLMAVACKYLRVIYAILTKGITYDPQRMLSDIKRISVKAA